jgi:O-antigen/teichoic acid export membrane protein
MIRYSATYNTNGDRSAFQNSLTNNFSFSILSAILIALVVLILGYFSEFIFKVNIKYEELTKQLFYLASAYSFTYFIGQLPSNILQGFGVFQKRNLYQIIILILTLFLVFMVYFYKIDIIIFCFCTLLINVTSVFLDFFLLSKLNLMRGIKYRFILNGKLIQNDYFKYSLNLFILSIVGFFSQQADKFILSSIIGFSSVAIYTIITKPYYIVKGLFANIYSVIQPILVQEHERGNIQNLRKIVLDLTKICFVLVATLTVFVFIFFGNFLEIWLGTSLYNSYFVWGGIAMINLLLSSLYGPVFRYFYFTGNTKVILKFDVVSALLNGLISAILSFYWGLQGVIIGTTIQMTILLFGLSYEAWRKLKINWFDLYNKKFALFSIYLIFISLFAIFLEIQNDNYFILISEFLLTGILVFGITFLYLRSENLLKYFFKK